MIRIGLIGYGYWGPNIARNIHESGRAKLAMIAEVKADRREVAARQNRDANVVADYRSGIAESKLDAVVVATPLSTHEELASFALDSGCHVLVEKPIAASSQAAAGMIEKAATSRRVLMVDHTFVFSAPVAHMKSLVEQGELGNIFYFDSVRVNLGLFQHDTNVLWDLAVHDVSIMRHVLDAKIVAVSATGLRNVGQHENVSFLTLFFEGDTTIGHVHVNWLAPVKMRRSVICGSTRMVVWDDLNQAEPLRIYDKGIEIQDSANLHDLLVSYRIGDAMIPRVPLREPLQGCVQHFLDCIDREMAPTTSGEFGLDVVRIIEAAQTSLQRKGAPVEVAP